jgi:ubiquinone/menaquinone biosynthesis C-methylase UbiE
MSYLSRVHPGAARGRALDFGCGVGRLTQALGDHYEEVEGIDIAPSMVSLAARHNRHGERCRYRVNAASDLTVFASGTFDLVYSNIVLQHMEPRFSKPYIAEFVRLLRPGGVTIFQLPSRRTAEPRSGRSAGIRKRLSRAAPGPVLALYRSLRTRFDLIAGRASFDCYEVGRDEVLALLEASGARVLDVVADGSGGPAVEGFRYCALKP